MPPVVATCPPQPSSDASHHRSLGCSAHCFAIAAVEREGDADLLAIVAGDLQPVGAPAGVALVDRNPTIVAPLLPPFAVTLKEQPVHLHDAVDALWIGLCTPGLLGLSAQQGMHAAIAVGGQICDSQADRGDELGHEAFLPAPHARLRLARRRHDRNGAYAIRRQQDDPRPPSMLLRRSARGDERLKPSPL